MKYDDLDLIGLLAVLFIVVIAIVALICTHEAKRKKPNIRVPRETLWGRTQRYHEGRR